MTRLLAGGLALVVGTEVLAWVLGGAGWLLPASGAAAALVLAAAWLGVGRGRHRGAAEPVTDDAAESLQRWRSRTESSIQWADATRADWDRHLRPRLAREFVLATRQRDPAALAATGRIVFGDDRGQSELEQFRFRASGLGHLTAVSGQNVAFVLVAASPLLRRLRLRWRWAATVALLGWFAVVTRLEPSVLRAVAMSAVAATAAVWLFGTLWALGVALTGEHAVLGRQASSSEGTPPASRGARPAASIAR